MFDPVAHIERHHPEFTVGRAPLRGALSCVKFGTKEVLVSDQLDEAGFRSSVCHEGVHLDRGDRCSLADTTLDARRELAVEREAARRLVPFDRLLAALTFGRDDAELAQELGVDVHMLHVRLDVDTLSEDEQDRLRALYLDQRGWTVA